MARSKRNGRTAKEMWERKRRKKKKEEEEKKTDVLLLLLSPLSPLRIIQGPTPPSRGPCVWRRKYNKTSGAAARHQNGQI